MNHRTVQGLEATPRSEDEKCISCKHEHKLYVVHKFCVAMLQFGDGVNRTSDQESWLRLWQVDYRSKSQTKHVLV